MNLKGYGRKRLRPNLRYYHGIRPEGLSKTKKTSVKIAGLRVKIEPRTSRIRRRSVNHSTTTFGTKCLRQFSDSKTWIDRLKASHIKVNVSLRLTVSQSWCRVPFGYHYQILLFYRLSLDLYSLCTLWREVGSVSLFLIFTPVFTFFFVTRRSICIDIHWYSIHNAHKASVSPGLYSRLCHTFRNLAYAVTAWTVVCLTAFEVKFDLIVFKHSVRTASKTQPSTITEINQLMLFTETKCCLAGQS
jgi:hypothetical protein